MRGVVDCRVARQQRGRALTFCLSGWKWGLMLSARFLWIALMVVGTWETVRTGVGVTVGVGVGVVSTAPLFDLPGVLRCHQAGLINSLKICDRD